MSHESPDVPRDEDGFMLWTADASRAIALGDCAGAMWILIEGGHDELAAERFVAVSLAINTPCPLKLEARLEALVLVARHAMEATDWDFASVAGELERAQMEMSG